MMDSMFDEKWILALLFAVPLTAVAQSAGPIVEIAREYQGVDCVGGVLTVEKDAISFFVAAPYKHDKPRLAELLPGTFDAELKGDARAGWNITYIATPGAPATQLHIGSQPYAGPGNIAIGRNPSSVCSFPKRSEYARAAHSFAAHLKPFQLGPKGVLLIKLQIDDR